MKSTKHSILTSALTMLVCLCMFVGSTFAWFSDSVTSSNNIIQSGTLDLEMYWTDNLDTGTWYNVEDAATNTVFSYDNWEPGYTDVRYIKIKNVGNLALNYQLAIEPQGKVGKLAEVINVYFANEGINIQTREDLNQLGTLGFLNHVMNGGATASGTLLPASQQSPLHDSGEIIVTMAMSMITSAGNEYQDETIGDGFTIKALATQASYEKDSFDELYDNNAELPESLKGDSASGTVTSENGVVTQPLTLKGKGVTAYVPAGVLLEDGVTQLELTVTPLKSTTSDITVVNNEVLIPVDVHIEGISQNNTTPIIIDLGEVLPKYLNMGNYHLYHVEGNNNNEMALVDTKEELNAHNQYTYDLNTGAVTLAMATFSEVALIADTANGWNGEYDYSWYTNTLSEEQTTTTIYTISNADQLAAFGAIVGGMNGQTKDPFKGETVKLISDINLGDKESENNPDLIFYPIGYYNSKGSYEKTSGVSVTSSVSSFEGTFDGNGHTISNFYQNTWEMFGDYNDGYSGTPNYYKDAMGLFGYVLNGTVKNLTVNNFSSDGEYTPTGVIAAYAAGKSTFENIAITNCNPRVYNTGNGGIIGIAGDTGKLNDDHITLTNITVDNSNKISALWGSWDVACGGLVGMYRGNVDGSGNATGDTISFVNCHVSAIIDVYNDVCANYQYYAYRYSGMIIGSVRHNTNKDGKTIPNMTGISASGCTVNYGDWNDYYYCEFEKNTMASYSEDYQFSRVPHSELKFTDSNENGVVDANERSSVTGCKHVHTAEENHQAIYLPFHQLFTGYSWGVSSIGLEKYGGIETNLDITEGVQQESVEKFIGKGVSELENETPIQIGTLFSAVSGLNDGYSIIGKDVKVFVSPANEQSSVIGTHTNNESDWTQGTLILKGNGSAKISITDYNFCKTTTITVNVIEKQDSVKFDKKFKQNFLYRVGNKNEVALGSLFEEKDEIVDSNVEVTFETKKGNAFGVYTINEKWEEGKIQFTGNGVVKVIITDKTYCTPTELMLEVVDATNVIKYADLKELNTVLLDNIEMDNGKTYRLTGNKTLYGNGFTFDVSKGAFNGTEYDYQSYVVYLENSILDNVIIKGAVYPEIGGTRKENYHRAIVMTYGNCKILNSYISNGASPIRNGGNLLLSNTTLKGGAWANLDLRNGHLILDNVTTINQVGLNDKYSDDTEVVGMGIVVYQEGGSEELKITIKNQLKQYNYLSKTQANQYLASNTYSSVIKDTVFGNDFVEYQNDGTINFGIVSMNNFFTKNDLVDERDNKCGYFGKEIEKTLLNETRNCYVYSFKPGSEVGNPDTYLSAGQGTIEPTVVFDFENKNYVAKTEGSNDYCYEDGGIVYISMDEGEKFDWNTSILTVTKYGNSIDYTVSMNDTDYTNKTISFNQPGKYTVNYSYKDSYNYILEEKDSNIDLSIYSKTYTKSIEIQVAVVEKSAKNASFSFGKNGTTYNSKTAIIGDKTYVMPDVSATETGKIGSKTVNGQTVYYPIVEMYTNDGKEIHTGIWYACFPIFKDVVQIIDYADKGKGDPITYNQETVTKVDQIPPTLKAVDPQKAFLYSMNATNYPPPTDPTTVNNAVCYTCNRNGLDATIKRNEEDIVAEYTYRDNVGTTYYYYVGYHCVPQNNCITPDTLITLADGTQKRVDSLKGDEELLVWNLESGKYDKAPMVFIDTEEEAEYEVVHLYFSDKSDVKVISEHGFFDLDLGKYVYIDAKNYADYVGHKFVKEGNISNDSWEVVTLDKVVIEKEVTTAWSPVTYKHLCYYTNGVLSMPGGIDGLFNIFDVNVKTMRYDIFGMIRDLCRYGVFTYNDFEGMIPEEAYHAFNGQYLKVAIGKGLITWDDIARLAERYVPLMR